MTDSLLDFLWPNPPADGLLSTWVKGDRDAVFFNTGQFGLAHDYMTSQAARGDVYFVVGLLKERPLSGRGTAKDVGYLSTFIMDFDLADPDAHKCTALPVDLAELQSFLAEINLPAPSAMVNSGHGIHAYFRLEEPQLVENAAKAHANFQQTIIRLAGDLRGWKFDNTSDLPRVLRYPQTLNHKTSPARVVEFLTIHEDRSYTLESLAEWMASHPTFARSATLSAKKSRERAKGASHKPDFESVRAGCGWVEHAAAQDHLDEPSWHTIANLTAHCEDGEAIFHDLSSKDSRYREEETAAKVIRAEASASPILCKTIQEKHGDDKCTLCPLRNKDRSPISFGHRSPAAAAILRRYVLDTDKVRYFDLETQTFLSTDSFDALHSHLFPRRGANKALVGDVITHKVHRAEYLPDHPRRFKHCEADVEVLNTWVPSPLVATDGTCAAIQRHFDLMIPDDAILDHLLNCLAFMVQQPGKKIKHAFLLTGKQGTGKSLLYQLVGKLLGERNCHVMRGEKFGETFNAHMTDHQLLIVEELPISNKLDTYNTVKTLITERTQRVEEKHVKGWNARTPDFILATSNHDVPIKLEKGDRRICVYNSPMVKQTGRYYAALATAIDEEASTFLHFLKGRDLEGFDRNAEPPMTDAKQALIRASGSHAERGLEDLVEDGHPIFERDLIRLEDVRHALVEPMGKFPTVEEVKRALSAKGAVSLKEAIRINGERRRFWAWRNPPYWQQASAEEIRRAMT